MKSHTSVTLRLLGTLVLLSLLALPVAAGLRPAVGPRPDPDPIVEDTCWTFRGDVLDYDCPDPTTCPLAGVQMRLIGTNNGYPNQRGTLLVSTETLADGTYELTTCDGGWDYYQVQLTLPQGCTAGGNGTPPGGGAAWTSTMIEYTWPLTGKDTTHDRFWLSCEEPTPTPTATPQCWRLQGKVFDADYPGETQPLHSIGLSLVGCNDPYPVSGTVIMTSTTNSQGWYGLNACDGPVTFDWYRIHLQVPAGWETVNATSVDGDVQPNKQVIEFVWPLSTKDLTGNKFWIRPLQGPTPTPTPTEGPVEPCENILPHGSFEDGILPPWQTLGVAQVSSQYGHDGSKSVLLTDVNNSDGELVAEIPLPPTAASLTLRYWWLAVSQDPDLHDDFLNVVIEWPGGGDHLARHEHWENPGYWYLVEVDLLPYAGRHVTLVFHGHNGPLYPSSWFVDHVEIEFCPAGGGELRLYLPLIVKETV